MKKILNFIVLACFLTGFATLNGCSESENEKIPIQISDRPTGLPTVTTSIIPESITATSVIAEGNVTSEGDAPVYERGFDGGRYCREYSTSGTGKFACKITGLWPGTVYRLIAYAKNCVGIAYGNVVGFSTPTPDVTTDLVTVVSQTATTVIGSVTKINSSDIEERGICYGTAPAPTTEGLRVVFADEDETFTCNLQNLIPGTQYYVRAYVSGCWS